MGFLKSYTSKSGTGTGNVWTPHPASTVGLDQEFVDGQASTVTTVATPLQLSVPFHGETDAIILATNINSLTITSYCKGNSTSAGGCPSIYTHSNWYYGSFYNLTTSYQNYTAIWSLNPFTESAWTWTEINALNGGFWAFYGPYSYTSDCTFLTVDYSYEAGDIGINNCFLAFR